MICKRRSRFGVTNVEGLTRKLRKKGRSASTVVYLCLCNRVSRNSVTSAGFSARTRRAGIGGTTTTNTKKKAKARDEVIRNNCCSSAPTLRSRKADGGVSRTKSVDGIPRHPGSLVRHPHEGRDNRHSRMNPQQPRQTDCRETFCGKPRSDCISTLETSTVGVCEHLREVCGRSNAPTASNPGAIPNAAQSQQQHKLQAAAGPRGSNGLRTTQSPLPPRLPGLFG